MPLFPSRPSATSCSPADAPSDAWQRGHRWWHVLFYALLIISLFGALADQPWSAHQALIVTLSGGLALWYGLLVMRGGAPRGQFGRMLLYCGGAFLFWTALVTLNPAYFLLLFALYGQVYDLLPLRWALGISALLTVVMIWRNASIVPAAALPTIATLGVISLFLGGWFASWISGIIEQSRERRLLIEQLEATRRELAASEREAGSLAERQRLAGEIHDTLAQGFVSVVLHLEAAESTLERQSLADVAALRRHLDDARRVARENLAEARRLVWALRPELLEDRTLGAALARVARRWSEETGVVATCTVTGDERQLPPEHEVALLRAAQEGLANARKHAQATEVVITLTYLDDTAILDAQDDGRGFAPDALAPPLARPDEGGYGLWSMRERIEALGGTLTIESAPGEGTTLVVQLPLDLPVGGLTLLATADNR